jgi:hypothetical protein
VHRVFGLPVVDAFHPAAVVYWSRTESLAELEIVVRT